MLKPIPSFPPLFVAIAVLMPMIWPCRFTSGPAAVAGVDGGVRLQKVLGLKTSEPSPSLSEPPPLGADDPIRQGLAESEGASHRQDHMSDGDPFAVSPSRRPGRWPR